MSMDENLIRQMVADVLRGLSDAAPASEPFPVEVSARHVHLCERDLRTLFGSGYALKPKKELSQPGQFLCEERICVSAAGGQFASVAILGPVRGQTQIEISAGDARALGISPPLRLSGEQGGSQVCLLRENAAVFTENCTMIVKSHLHLTPADAERLRVSHGGNVRVRLNSKRPLVLENVAVRVDENFRLALHIDTDEANACLLGPGDTAVILPAQACACTEKPMVQEKPVVSERKLFSERDAFELIKSGAGVLNLNRGAVITPLARDALKAAGVQIHIINKG